MHAVTDPAGPAAAPPAAGADWTGLVAGALPVDVAQAWAHRSDCGAVVSFSGVARDHSADRDGVTLLTYEAWEEAASARLAEVAAEARRRWPELGPLVLLHRTGDVAVGEAAVVVVAAAPHRGEAFDAARFAIDAVKATVPLWKRERWAGGDDWGLEGAALVSPTEVPAR